MSEAPSDRGRSALAAAGRHENDVVRFLREMIAIPAESAKEGERAERIRRAYERLGFDEVFFDRLGNVLAAQAQSPDVEPPGGCHPEFRRRRGSVLAVSTAL